MVALPLKGPLSRGVVRSLILQGGADITEAHEELVTGNACLLNSKPWACSWTAIFSGLPGRRPIFW